MLTMKGTIRTAALTLVLLLLAGPVALLAGINTASAQIKRVAIVDSLKGTVNVLKSGGSKPFKAFKNMSLNEGDQISTGKDGTVELELASDNAAQDHVTIGSSSQVTFSKLKDDKSVKTKMNIWAGSLWLKVKSVSNANDQFEVETPTSIMGVRGTHFFVSVDPYTGLSRLFTAAGVVEASTNSQRWNADNNEQEPNSVMIYPSQQLVESNFEQGVESSVSYADLNELVRQTPAEILKQIIKDAPSIRKEQEQLISNLQKQLDSGSVASSGGLIVRNADDLNRIKNNLDNLVSSLAQNAVSSGKIDQETVEQLANQANEEAGQTVVDLNKKIELQLTSDDQSKMQKQQELLDSKKKEADKNTEQKQQELQNKSDEVKQLLDKKQEQQQTNTKIIEETKTSTSDSSSNGDSSSDSGDSSSGASPASGVTVDGDTTTTADQLMLDLNVNLGGFSGSKRIYGYQVEVSYETPLTAFNADRFSSAAEIMNYRGGNGLFKVEPKGTKVSGADSADEVRVTKVSDTASSVFYSVTKFSGDPVEVTGTTTVVKLPFIINRPASLTSGGTEVPVKFTFNITAYDENGAAIKTAVGQIVTLNVTFAKS